MSLTLTTKSAWNCGDRGDEGSIFQRSTREQRATGVEGADGGQGARATARWVGRDRRGNASRARRGPYKAQSQGLFSEAPWQVGVCSCLGNRMALRRPRAPSNSAASVREQLRIGGDGDVPPRPQNAANEKLSVTTVSTQPGLYE